MTKTKKGCLIVGTTLVSGSLLTLVWCFALPWWLIGWREYRFWTVLPTCLVVGIFCLIACLPEPPPLRPVPRPVPPPKHD